ncbi:CDP-glycerol glycerophosphotransferase family protein [Gracilibacillus lacisalsi]|uniref:CDP-glycerol glycerophosphotransferase family protein n=1 Tax=Gracilibacillus lacisalsi TaxID=393087 RepID=UPI00036DA560|nr:CDP-glycerol glycerophosphotransferase family protein [Gracilibacillus lacisalsi]
MKVIIFGTGNSAENAIQSIDGNVQIIAIVDNDYNNMSNNNWNGYKVIDLKEIVNYDYDYILICSIFTNEIMESLLHNKVSRNKIIPLYDNYYPDDQRNREKEIRNLIFPSYNNNNICLITRRNSGCNALALYKNLPNYLPKNIIVDLLDYNEYQKHKHKFDTVVSTHMESRYYKNSLNIETWHGFPLKSIGISEKNRVDNYSNMNGKIDRVISYSDFYSYIMSSLFQIDIEKFIVTGMPRNDLLNNPNSRSFLEEMINCNTKGKKIIMYVPTFRYRKEKKVNDGDTNIFFNKEELTLINNFLLSNDSYLVMKPHPIENVEWINGNFENIFCLTDDDFNKQKIDFYEILNSSDVLITDYSSIYFDYLLLDKPIVYYIKDQKIYEEQRGFIIEHPEILMPGPVATNFKDLIFSIKSILNNNELYSEERNRLKHLIHAYTDFNSSPRVWEAVLKVQRGEN